MKNFTSTTRVAYFNQFLIALFLFSIPLAGIYAACCSGHGGVASCNKKTGHQMCKDGTASPSCLCEVPKKIKKSSATTTKSTVKTSTSSTTVKTKPTVTKTTTTKTRSTTTNAKGCCSKHGGIVGCDKATGHQLCKDGSASPTCTCM